MKSPIATAVAISFGLLVLIAYFIPPVGPLAFLVTLRTLLVGLAVVTGAAAGLVAIFNLALVHLGRINAKKNPDRYSIALIVAFLVTLAAGLWLGPADPGFQRVVTSIQVPVEAALLGLVAVTLTLASFRLFQRRRGVMGITFIISAIVFMLITGGLLTPLEQSPALAGLVDWLRRLPLAGGRGILIGVALGSLTAGLRILLGADRPYSG